MNGLARARRRLIVARMRTTPTTSVPEVTSATRRMRPIRRGTSAALVTVTLCSAAPAAAGNGGALRQPVTCTVTPTANSMPFDVSSLLATVRSNGDVIEMLHDVICTEGHGGTTWMVIDLT
jgi:prophage DNA circulation protein